MEKSALINKITLKIARKYRQWERSYKKFIREAVKIEDRDAVDTVISFKMWKGQEDALDIIHDERLTIIMKARQLGLTWLVLSYALWILVFQKGKSVVAISYREDPDAKELIRRLKFILLNLPSWLIRENVKAGADWDGPVWESTVLTITIKHPDGEPSVFRSLTASPESGRSFTANLVILDEWAFQQYAGEIWESAFPVINRPTGGKVVGLSTNKRGTLFEYIYRESMRGLMPFKTIFLPWYTDPRRDTTWYEATKKAIPGGVLQEYPATVEEAMSAGEGTAFPEFSRDIHVCEPFPIPQWWYKWRANDPGYTDPFFWVWLTVSPDGIVYAYREYTRRKDDKKITYSKQAAIVKSLSAMKDDEGIFYHEDLAYTVVGRDAFTRDPESGKSIVNYYQDSGVLRCIAPPRDKRTDRIQRKMILHEYLQPYLDENDGQTKSKLQIFSNCNKLIETIPMLVVDHLDAEKVEEHKDDHAYDALGMGLQSWHAKGSRKPSQEETNPIMAHKYGKARSQRRRRIL